MCIYHCIYIYIYICRLRPPRFTGEPLASLELDGSASLERLEAALRAVAPLPARSRRPEPSLAPRLGRSLNSGGFLKEDIEIDIDMDVCIYISISISTYVMQVAIISAYRYRYR